MDQSKEYIVEHTVRQVVRAENADAAEKEARRAIEYNPTLWWPSVAHIGQAKQVDGG